MNKHAANLSSEESPWGTKAGPARQPNRGFGGVGGFLFPKTLYKHKIWKTTQISVSFSVCI
jgi:hypothetical protein